MTTRRPCATNCLPLPFITEPSSWEIVVGAPAPPPRLPRAGCSTRSNIAWMSNSCPSCAPTSIYWPRPPRVLPTPPESGRNSLRQIITGPACSVASIGIVITPDGKAVAFKPSWSGRAPDPPELKVKTSDRRASSGAGASVRGRRETWKLQRQPAPSAGTKPGTILSKAS